MFIELKPLLREIAELYRFSNNNAPIINRLQSQEHFDESRFSRTVVTHNTHLLKPREVVVEVFEDGDRVEGLRDILALKNFASDIDVRGLQADLALFNALLSNALQFVEGILTIFGLMATGLGHTTHPFQLSTIQIIGTHNLCTLVIDTLLTLLQIIGIIATIGIDGLVVEFQNDGAYPIQEIAVMSHHEQRLVTPLQIALQPLYHLQVQMVGGLVKDDKVGFRQQHVGQCHTFLLSTRKLSHGLLQIANLQLCQHLLGLQDFLWITLMVKACVKYALLRVEHGRLLQHPYFQVTTEHNVTTVVTLLTREYRQQCRLTRTVLGYQSHLLAFADGEADVAEQRQGAERLRQMLHV